MGNLICTIILGNIKQPEVVEFKGDVIGVDYGAYYCAIQGYPMKLAIGDFDSIDQKDLSFIDSFSEKLIVLNPVKDVSDFEAALEHTQKYEKIYVYGGLGGRLDHQYSLLIQVMKDKRLIALNKNNKMYSLSKGKHIIDKNAYKYLSMFALEPSLVSINGVKYPLSHKVLDVDNTFTLSNEIIKDECELTLLAGELLIIQSND